MPLPGARVLVSAFAALLVVPAVAGPPATAADGLRLKQIGTFDTPVYVAGPKGDRKRVFVVEKTGRIMVVRKGRTLSKPFLNLSSRVSSGNEQGLLSMAFHPRYERNRRFYVNYTDRGGDTRIVEFKRRKSNPNRARRASARVLLTVAQPAANHNGGQIQFGPDRKLFIGMGDGGGGGDPDNNAQDPGSLLGKMLRIDPRAKGSREYTVPQSNPFVGRAAYRPEIYSLGLRNPWRFSFDRENGALIIADVGQGDWEEIDYMSRGTASGANFGWRVFEGSHRYTRERLSGMVRPTLEMSHADGWCAVTGGYVVRKSSSSLDGRYVYGDFCRGDIRSALLSPGRARSDRATGLTVDSLASFGEDGRGRVYAVSLSGPVYRIAG